jgi:hypothetical protein
VDDPVRRIRAIALLLALVVGNAGLLALAFPAQSAPLCHEQPAASRIQGASRCQWASPIACCDALAAVQAGLEVDLPALAPGFANPPPAPSPGFHLLAYADPAERVPLPPRSPILRL